MQKRGLLLAEETLKIVIAVICIAFLVFFLTQLYFAKINAQKQRQAESHIGIINEKIDSYDPEFPDLNQYRFPNPIGWYIFAYTEGAEKRPNSCLGRACMCICENVWDVFDRQIKYCDESGACLIVEGLINFDDLEIKQGSLTSIKIEKVAGDRVKITPI